MKENTSANLMMRRPNLEDLAAIEDLGKKVNHPLPEKFDRAAIVEKGDELISLGVVRHILEALLYTSGSDRDKVESLKQLIRQAKTDSLMMNADSIYVFAQNEEFAKILEKHFDFRRLTSIPMILELK